MTEEEADIQQLRDENQAFLKRFLKDQKKIKMLHKFIKQLAAAYRMHGGPMHYVRTCKCDMCVLLREARDITK